MRKEFFWWHRILKYKKLEHLDSRIHRTSLIFSLLLKLYQKYQSQTYTWKYTFWLDFCKFPIRCYNWTGQNWCATCTKTIKSKNRHESTRVDQIFANFRFIAINWTGQNWFTTCIKSFKGKHRHESTWFDQIFTNFRLVAIIELAKIGVQHVSKLLNSKTDMKGHMLIRFLQISDSLL